MHYCYIHTYLAFENTTTSKVMTVKSSMMLTSTMTPIPSTSTSSGKCFIM